MGRRSKKKIEIELDIFFPDTSESPRVKEYFSLIQKRTVLTLQKVRGMKVGEELETVNDQLFSMYDPKTFTGRQSQEVKFIKGFEEAVVFLNQYIPRDPKSMTVLEFYQTLETIKKQTKKVNGKSY